MFWHHSGLFAWVSLFSEVGRGRAPGQHILHAAPSPRAAGAGSTPSMLSPCEVSPTARCRDPRWRPPEPGARVSRASPPPLHRHGFILHVLALSAVLRASLRGTAFVRRLTQPLSITSIIMINIISSTNNYQYRYRYFGCVQRSRVRVHPLAPSPVFAPRTAPRGNPRLNVAFGGAGRGAGTAPGAAGAAWASPHRSAHGHGDGARSPVEINGSKRRERSGD